MSERYWISGAQIGMLRVLNRHHDNIAVDDILTMIERDQFIGDNDDMQKMLKHLQTEGTKP
jgi:hypothetical protein